MSDVEKYWEAIRAKWPSPVPTWQHLGPQDQMMVLQSINILINILNNNSSK